MTETELPRLEDCLELYAAAVERYGSKPFTAARAKRELAGTPSTGLLELAVAYGLFEFDGDAYAVRVEPDEPERAWRANAIDRAERIRTAAVERASERTGGTDGVRALTHDSRRFASVAVGERAALEGILDRLEGVPLEEYDGIVLRSPGEHANAVQRLADRLCEPAVANETDLSRPFQKESTDVVGDDKNDLEFRLFLERE
ncbi:hypothetical protein C491_06558 [Natronococcus amylolyticus DSM 10524]|uniref:Uncharacterized protein n=1 Tax=Natronococcus amylolyticus DSM 10524 TaxID=1227497 RepID=L9XCJ7_9EURY|nr:hypothetical protein [Natronococcus amylolyticus]ELY59450.1 hypothetical protein C491_06558 [Natronococcus amylolyticus DSM 10524]